MKTFARSLGVKVIHVDAAATFMGHLAGVTDPEQKRKIIGREFVEVFQAEAQKLPDAKWLAQGTIYPDVIESAGAKTRKAHTIKSHHNVGGLPETLNQKLLEPLRELFKDEVRELGVAKTIADLFRYRQTVGVNVALEGLREALRQKKASPAEIAREAVDAKVWKIMEPYMSALTSHG